MSRCTTLRACAYASASATSDMIRADFVGLHRALLAQPLREIVAVDVTHDEEDEIVGFFDVVDRDDVRMAQLRSSLGLAQKARTDVRTKCQIGRKQLDRDDSLEAPVRGTIHDAHSAAANFLAQLIVGLEDALELGAKCVVRPDWHAGTAPSDRQLP